MNFCEKNDGQSKEAIRKIFDGIDENQLITAIQTIIKMERNISEL